MDLEIEQFTTLITLIKASVKVVEDWRLAEFQAKKDVEQHLEPSPQDEFASQKQFEHLVASQFEEQHRRKPPTAPKPVISQPPPSTSDEKSFQQLIKSEERLRENSQQNDQELLSMLGGKAVAHAKQTGITGNLKSLQISPEASEADPWSQVPSQPSPQAIHHSQVTPQMPSATKEPDFSLLSQPVAQNQSTSNSPMFQSGPSSNPSPSRNMIGNYNPAPVRTNTAPNQTQPARASEPQYPARSNFTTPTSTNSGSGIINPTNSAPTNAAATNSAFMNPNPIVNFPNPSSSNFVPSANTGPAFINPSPTPSSVNPSLAPTANSGPINSAPGSHGQSVGFTGFNLEPFTQANFSNTTPVVPPTQIQNPGFSSAPPSNTWEAGFGSFQAADVPSTNSNMNFGSFTSAQAVPGFPSAQPTGNNFGTTMNLDSFQQAPSFQGANPQGGFDFAMFPTPPKPKSQNDNVWGSTNFSADAFFS
jgi:hypothetical protein